MAANVPQGGVIRANKRWRNVGDQAGVKDVAAIYGHVVGEELQTVFGAVVIDVSIDVGQELTTPVDCPVPPTAPAGLMDAIVGVGEYDAATSIITLESWEVVLNALNVVSGVPTGVVPEEVSASFAAV